MTKSIVSKALLDDLRRLIAEARQDVARTGDSAPVMLYWRTAIRGHLGPNGQGLWY
jgi:hypothetical protein